MIIAVEGVDGTGKSTLATQLGERLGWPVLHWSNPGRTSTTALLPHLLAGPVILDRAHLTPQLYGEVLRGKPDLSEYDYWALTGVLRAKRCATIVCSLDDFEETWSNVNLRPQLFKITRSQLMRLDARFRTCSVDGDVRFDYDYRVHSVDQLADKVAHWMVMIGDAPDGVMGTPRPLVWLVGDQKAQLGKLESVPFYAEGISDKLLSGTLLYRAMKLSKLTWDHVALSNSVLYGREVDLDDAHAQLGRPPTVVALGALASKRLHAHRIEHEMVPHPQWWRRFRHHNPAGYAQRLALAASGAAVGAREEAR